MFGIIAAIGIIAGISALAWHSKTKEQQNDYLEKYEKDNEVDKKNKEYKDELEYLEEEIDEIESYFTDSSNSWLRHTASDKAISCRSSLERIKNDSDTEYWSKRKADDLLDKLRNVCYKNNIYWRY